MASGKTTDRAFLLSKDDYLGGSDFDIADCYSDHGSDFNGVLHFHDFYELSMIYEGRSEFLVSGETFRMNSRSIQLIRPSDYHRQNVRDGDYIRYYNLMFTDNLLPKELREKLGSDDRPLCAEFAPDGTWKHLQTSTVYALSRYNQPARDLPVEILAKSLIELLCYELLCHREESGSAELGSAEGAVRAAIGYVQKNYRRPITLSDAAAAAGLSVSYFSTLFRQVMGIRFSDYLTGYRLKIADRYLRTGDLTVKEIAPLCGFSTTSYFVTQYRRQYGVTPGQRGKKDGRG